MAGDLLVMMVVSRIGYAAPTVYAWQSSSKLQAFGGSGAEGEDAGTMYVKLWYRVSDGTESGATETVEIASGNAIAVTTAVYRSTTGFNMDMTGGESAGADNSPGTSWSVTGADSMDVCGTDVVLTWTGFNGATGAIHTSSTLTIPGVTMSASTEREEFVTSLGNDAQWVYAEFTTTSGLGNGIPVLTSTLGTSFGDFPAGATVFFRMRTI